VKLRSGDEHYAVTQLRALLRVDTPVHKLVKVLYARRKKQKKARFVSDAMKCVE